MYFQETNILLGIFVVFRIRIIFIFRGPPLYSPSSTNFSASDYDPNNFRNVPGETIYACEGEWVCEHRWPGIRNTGMKHVQFKSKRKVKPPLSKFFKEKMLYCIIIFYKHIHEYLCLYSHIFYMFILLQTVEKLGRIFL